MRRRTAICLAEVPRPLDVETEILYAIDARQKLQAAIESENRKRAAAEIEFARLVVKEIHSWQVVNVEVAIQRDFAAKSAAERSKQRIEALQSLLAKVNKRIEQLKYDSPDAVNAGIAKKIEALEKTLSARAGGQKEIEEEIGLLKAEVVKLPKPPAKKAS